MQDGHEESTARPGFASLRNAIRDRAKQRGDAIAIATLGDFEFNYAELNRRIESFEHQFDLSAAPRIASILSQRANTVVAALAAVTTATYAPLNPAVAIPELETKLNSLQADVLLFDEDAPRAAVQLATSLGIQCIDIDREVKPDSSTTIPGSKTNDRKTVAADDASRRPSSLLLFTSGTAAQKLVALTDENLNAATNSICESLGLTDADRCLALMPYFHIHGLSIVFATLMSGGTVICPGEFTAEAFYQSVAKSHPTWYSAAPAIHRMVLDASELDRRSIRESSFRFIRSASAPMPRALIHRMEACFGVPFIEAYGMTEAAPHLCSNRIVDAQRRIGSVGRPAGTQVLIIDEEGAQVEKDELGEIVVRGTNVIQSYVEESIGDDACFVDIDGQRWLKTGDIGHLDQDGFLFVTDRVKEQINRGGEKISPREVDEALLSHPAVRDALSFSVPDVVLGETVAAAVVLHPDFLNVSQPEAMADQLTESIRSLLATKLSHYKIPQVIEIVPQIESFSGGKRRRSAIADRLRPLISQRTSTPNQQTSQPAISLQLQEIWSDLLNTEVNSNSNFFALGGHSLTAFQMLHRVERDFQVQLTIGDVFRAPILRQFEAIVSHAINSAKQATPQSNPVVSKENSPRAKQQPATEYPATSGQARLWFLDHLEDGNAYNLSMPLWLTGELNVASLESAINKLLESNDVLRTRFEHRDGQLRQVIRPFEGFRLAVTQLDAEATEAELLAEMNRTAILPYDLQTGPLFRAKLFRLSNQKHLLLLACHHIISDGWSTHLIYRHLRDVYAAIESGNESSRREELHFGDYANWLTLPEQVLSREMNLRYWTAKLANAPEHTQLPSDRPRPKTPTNVGAVLKTSLSSELVRSCRQLAVAERTTPYVVFLTGFKLMLRSVATQNDLVVGTPIANRTRPEFEALIGFFANTLALRTELADELTFHECVQRVHQTATEAISRTNVPFSEIVDALGARRDLSRNPIFQVMFAYQNLPELRGETEIDANTFPFASLTAEPVRAEQIDAKFDITLYLRESQGAMHCEWQYRRELFDAESIERFDRIFQQVLAEALASPHRSPRPLHENALATSARRSDSQTASKSFISFTRRFEAQADATPHAIAVQSQTESLSYRELNERANRLALQLHGRGIEHGETIGVCMSRSCAAIVAILAVLKSRGTYVPLDPAYPANRLRYIVEDANIQLLITDETAQGRLSRVSHNDMTQVLLIDRDSMIESSEATGNLDEDPAGSDVAYIIYTSGSTGTPKGVQITVNNLTHYGPAIGNATGVNKSDRYLHTASLAFSSSMRQLVAPLSCGATILLASQSQIQDASELLRFATLHRATILDLVPSYLRACLALLEDAPESIPSSLRLLLTASEPLRCQDANRWYALRHNAQLINMYGQTETTGIAATYPVPKTLLSSAEIVSIGRGIEGCQLVLLDEDMNEVPADHIGEIYVSGNTVGAGYWLHEGLSSERFAEHQQYGRLYRTGDLGRLSREGNFIFVGRVDSQLKINGQRVEPVEIESALCTLPNIREAAVVLQLEAPPRLAAAILDENSPMDGSSKELLPKEETLAIRDQLANMLPPSMMPTRYYRVPSLPRSPNGKLDRNELKRLLSEEAIRPETGQTEAPKLDRRLPKMASLWATLLGVDQVEAKDNFFDLGGDSLLAVQLTTNAKKEDLAIELKHVFQYQTLIELAEQAVETRGQTECSKESDVSATDVVPPQNSQRSSSFPSVPVGVAPEETSTDCIRVSVEQLREFGREALERAGLDPRGASIVTEVQIESSLRGQPTHNVGDIPRYARRLVAGILNPRPTFQIEKETPISALIDGDNAPGQWTATFAMEQAIRIARTSGIGLVGVRRSNHFGAAGQYAWQAAREDLVGLVTTNGPLILAPTGGVTPTFGNNPIASGIPTNTKHPIVLDIAMSVVPRGKIGLTLAEGAPLGTGWILDEQGNPSTNLKDLVAGLGAPIGGHKGYGLALTMEILAGVLTGAGFCWDHEKHGHAPAAKGLDLGHLFIVIDPQLFMPLSEFKSRAGRLISQTKQGELAADAEEILVPGEIEMRARDENLKLGVPLRRSIWDRLLRYADRHGLTTKLRPN